MKSICKKSVALVLAVLMLVSLSITAFAAIGDQKFSQYGESDTLVITGYYDSIVNNGLLELVGSDKGTERPSGRIFSAVADEVFRYDANDPDTDCLADVTELIVDENIKNIGKFAFANLPKLEKVTFKDDVVLSEGAFSNCTSLKEVTFLKSADIADNAFVNCSALETLNFGSDAKLADTALTGCVLLANINIPNGAFFDADKSVLADTSFVADYDVDFVTIGSTLIHYKGSDAEVTIPLNVTAIGPGAFAGNVFLKKIKITKFVDTLGDKAFYNCVNLKDVVYSDYGEIVKVGTDVFTNTYYFDFFEGDFFTVGSILVKYVGEEAYVAIPNTVSSIAPNCFDGCYVSRADGGYTYVVSAIFVPASLKNFGENCFGLAELPDGTHYLPRIYAFENTDSMKALKDAGYDVTDLNKIADVNKDGIISAEDARLVLRIAVKVDIGVDPAVRYAADVNGDNNITSADARTTLRLAIDLEDYTAEDLLYMPRTKLEVLMAYTKAMKTIARYGAGYKKTTENVMANEDMSAKGKVYIYDHLASGLVNTEEVFEPDTIKALENINYCKLLSTKSIKSATCAVDGNKYTITIKFNDTLDYYGTSDITKVFPVQTYGHYVDMLKDHYWWNGTEGLNKITKFDLTYTNPTVELTMDADTYKITDCKLSVGHHFAVDGHINGLAVSSKFYKTGNATVDRLDTITYSDFIYTLPEIAE